MESKLNVYYYQLMGGFSFVEDPFDVAWGYMAGQVLALDEVTAIEIAKEALTPGPEEWNYIDCLGGAVWVWNEDGCHCSFIGLYSELHEYIDEGPSTSPPQVQMAIPYP